ncbi:MULTISPECIES: choice-of-anchor tandem repeat GloVer-containing protein [unclassified Carboxylicivirga]|uniref:choice-of-anchor tandem repeat GloVer-containing protein n=1 Tax=Carboxylicivirga TaxID=1628153 RepID=UPI003D34136A
MKRQLSFLSIFCLVTTFAVGQTPGLWGVTPRGGTSGNGVIFKTDGNGDNYSVMLDFPQESKDNIPRQTNFVETQDGKLYCVGGGSSYSDAKYGVIYQFDKESGVLSVVYEFVTSEGYNPAGSLTLHSNGLIYGLTTNGGTSNAGTIYTFNPTTKVKTDLHHLGSRSQVGSNPLTKLTYCSDAKFYGTFDYGGLNNNGTFYSFDPSNNEFTLIHAFEAATTGNRPVQGLVNVHDKIYGVTSSGGSNNSGTMFEYTISDGTFSIVYSFDNENGRTPYGGLTLHSNGFIYGTTQSGGYNNQGVIFMYNPVNGNYSRIYDFSIQTGIFPQGYLLEDEDGVLWGLTTNGGEDNGVLYSYDPTSYTYKVHYDFVGHGSNNMTSELLKASDGLIYGFRSGTGSEDRGVIYSLNPANDNYSVLANFYGKPYGKAPQGGFVQANNGLLYGVVQDGGMYSEGCIYAYNPALNTIDTLFHFVDDDTGMQPVGTLLQADNGKLYGVTYTGKGPDANGRGVLYEYDIKSDSYRVLKSLVSNMHGGSPQSNSLIQATNGLIYGTTTSYATNSGGALFSYNIETDEITVLHEFSGGDQGSQPYGKLLQASDGKLYGTTDRGGGNNHGTLFVFDIPTSSYATIHNFELNVNGGYPKGYLIEVGEGILYGLTENGGDSPSNNAGVLFTYDINTQSFAHKLNFNGIAGASPQSLVLASNGNLYGVCSYGGANGNSGTIFEYNPQINIIYKLYDFDNVTGFQPRYVSLIEVGCLPSYETIDVIACNTYTVPSGDETYTEEGTYTVMDTIPNTCSMDSIITVNLTLHHAPETIVDVELCLGEGYTFADGTQIEIISHNQSHTSVLIAQAHTGCDSIVTETLVVLPLAYHSVEYSLCAGSSFTYADGTEVNDIQADQSHVSTLTGAAYNGCDSIVTEILTVVSLDNTVVLNGNTLSAVQTDASYQWLDCEMKQSPIAGATSQTYVADRSGEYAVSITKEGCTVSSECVSVVITGVPQSADGHGMKVYPNPTSGMIYIDISDELLGSKIRILDLSGKLVYSGVAQSAMSEVELPLKPGIYIVEVITPDNQKKQFKVIKE